MSGGTSQFALARALPVIVLVFLGAAVAVACGLPPGSSASASPFDAVIRHIVEDRASMSMRPPTVDPRAIERPSEPFRFGPDTFEDVGEDALNARRESLIAVGIEERDLLDILPCENALWLAAEHTQTGRPLYSDNCPPEAEVVYAMSEPEGHDDLYRVRVLSIDAGPRGRSGAILMATLSRIGGRWQVEELRPLISDL